MGVSHEGYMEADSRQGGHCTCSGSCGQAAWREKDIARLEEDATGSSMGQEAIAQDSVQTENVGQAVANGTCNLASPNSMARCMEVGTNMRDSCGTEQCTGLHVGQK